MPDVTPRFKPPRDKGKPTRRRTVSNAARKRAEAEKAGVYADVIARSHGRDEQDPTLPAEAMHHRLLRSQGGQNTVENLLHVSHETHRLIHDQPSWAYRHGLLLRSWQDPAVYLPHVGCPLGCPLDHMEKNR
jgi:hypothetical protein